MRSRPSARDTKCQASLPARIGERRGHVPLLTFEKGAQMAQPVKHLETSLNGLKAGMRRGARAPPIV